MFLLTRSACRMFAMLVPALVLCGNAGANSLEISWIRSAATQLPGNSGLVVEGGGTDPTATVTSGLDIAATTYQASGSVLIAPPSVSRTYSSSFTTLAGGTVGYGYMRGVVAATIRTTYGPNEFSRAFLRANWIDMVAMMPDDPALLGTDGSAIGGVLLDFAIDSTASGFEFGNDAYNGSSFSIAIGGGGGPGSGGQFAYGCNALSEALPLCPSDAQRPPQHRTISVPVALSFVWGTPFELTAELTAESMSRGGVAPSSDPANLVFFADGSVNLLHTVLWQGITDARDSGNNPVSFTVTSDSHTNWAQPATAVPAPGTFVLLLTSTVGALVTRRRR